MAQNWNINPVTKDYEISNGKPVETDSLLIPAYIRLKTKRKGWMYAPDENYGSDLHTLSRKQTNRSPTVVENIAARALQPIMDEGRAKSITIDFAASARHGVGFETKIINAKGQIEQLNLSAIEV